MMKLTPIESRRVSLKWLNFSNLSKNYKYIFGKKKIKKNPAP